MLATDADVVAAPMPRDESPRTGIPFTLADAAKHGAIYPVPESDIVIPDFEIPGHWPRAYGLDVARNRTAAV